MDKRLPRLPTGIPGLDTLLDGGFIEGASYIVQGRPGAGKTIFCNQVAFAHAARGGHVLYVTLLAETHQRLFQALSILSFFDEQKLGTAVSYISVFRVLIDQGLDAVVDLLRVETSRVGATLLVFDGLLNARDRAQTDMDIKQFVAAVQNQAAFLGCTVLFLTSTRLTDESPEHTMVDGVIDLNMEVAGVRFFRSLQVLKSRGSAAMCGYHDFVINESGVVVYPRIELAYATPTRHDGPEPTPLASGVDGLDELIGGGLPTRSVTLLLGPSGAGKTSFGLSFLSASSAEAPALHFGFYETPERLLLKARSLGCPLDTLVATGVLEIIWRPLNENILDSLGHELLDAVRRRGVRRLVIDALGGFERATIHKERLVEFFATLANELRALDVTAIAAWEMRDLFGHDPHAPSPEISSILDNLLVLRSLRFQSRYKRVLSVLKMRDRAIEPAMHEVIFSDRGLRVSAGAQVPGAHPDLLPEPSQGV